MKIHKIIKEELKIFFFVKDDKEFSKIINSHLSHIKRKKTGQYGGMAVVTLTNEEDFEETLKILQKLERKNE